MSTRQTGLHCNVMRSSDSLSLADDGHHWQSIVRCGQVQFVDTRVHVGLPFEVLEQHSNIEKHHQSPRRDFSRRSGQGLEAPVLPRREVSSAERSGLRRGMLKSEVPSSSLVSKFVLQKTSRWLLALLR